MRVTPAILAACALTGCMTDNEYRLRRADIDARRAHPATYSPLCVKGPLNVPEGGELVLTVPNMPYAPAAIPDGQAYQLRALGIAAAAGAAVTGGYLIKSAGGGSSSSTVNNTTVNGGGLP